MTHIWPCIIITLAASSWSCIIIMHYTHIWAYDPSMAMHHNPSSLVNNYKFLPLILILRAYVHQMGNFTGPAAATLDKAESVNNITKNVTELYSPVIDQLTLQAERGHSVKELALLLLPAVALVLILILPCHYPNPNSNCNPSPKTSKPISNPHSSPSPSL